MWFMFHPKKKTRKTTFTIQKKKKRKTHSTTTIQSIGKFTAWHVFYRGVNIHSPAVRMWAFFPSFLLNTTNESVRTTNESFFFLDSFPFRFQYIGFCYLLFVSVVGGFFLYLNSFVYQKTCHIIYLVMFGTESISKTEHINFVYVTHWRILTKWNERLNKWENHYWFNAITLYMRFI